VLEARQLTKRYGASVALRDVTFSIAPGEILGYLGPNGSGKSTTVRMLVGLSKPTTGTIVFRGQDIQECLREYKSVVGYVPEEADVFTHLTAAEYLRFVGRLRRIDAGRLERRIDAFLAAFGLSADYHARLSAFSKGMKQKVLVAAALLHDPALLILDEPTSGLDVAAALVLRSAVRLLAQDGKMIFYSSHELDVVERSSTRVIILSEGRVVAHDAPMRLRDLMQAKDLEAVFAQLAIREDPDEIAQRVIEASRL
jgi:ABC-2 type transport system ATP-binding protein